MDSTNQAAELLRFLGKDTSNMKRSLQTSTILHAGLQWAIHSQFSLFNSPILPHPHPNSSPPHSRPIGLSVDTEAQTERFMIDSSPHEKQDMRRLRQLHSCPLIKVDHDDLEDQMIDDPDRVAGKVGPRIRTMESTAGLSYSLVTFVSLFAEFVARLNDLVEAVDELSKLAKFNQHAINPK